MNYNYNNTPPAYPNGNMVYHPKYGYIEENKLTRKFIRRDVAWLSGVTFGMYGMSLVMGVVLGIFLLFTGAYDYTGTLSSEMFYAMSALLVVLGTGLPFIVYLLVKHREVGDYLRFEKTGVFNSLLLILAGGGICLLGNFPAGFISQIVEGFGLEAGTSSLMPQATSPISMILYFFGVAILPPLFEELAFRGVVLSALRKYGDLFALFISSIIFALVHMSVTSIPFAFIAGLVMGYAYIKTSNLWVSIGIHFLNNAIAVVLDIITASTDTFTADIITTAIFYGFIIIGIVALIVLLIKKSLGAEFKGSKMICGGTDKLIATVLNPVFIPLVVVCLGVAVFAMFGI